MQQCSAHTPLPSGGWTYKVAFVGWSDVQWGVQNPFPGKNPGEVSIELMVSAAAMFDCRPDLNGANPANLPTFTIPATPRGSAYLGDQQVCNMQGGQSRMTLAFPGQPCPFAYSGGFPAATSFSANGSYPVKAYNIVNGPACTFWGPDPAVFNLRAPIVVFGIADGNTVSQYGGVFSHMASHGFVVMASNAPAPGSATLQACLNSLFEVSDSPGDPYYRKLNPNLIATAGHGIGAGGAVTLTLDPRVSAVVAYQPVLVAGTALASFQGGTAVITEVAEGRAFAQGIYDLAPSPAVYAEDQTNSTSLNLRKQTIGLAFLRWRLMQDQTAAGMFNQSCSLCTDPGWRVQRK